MNIIRANEAKGKIRNEMSVIFVDGFYQWLNYFSKDKAKLYRTFAHMFNTEVFYTAAADNHIASIAACTNNTPAVRLKYSEFRKHLGLIMGSIAYIILKKEFEKKQYPFQISENMGAIEFVATSVNYRGQGVAAELLKSIMDSASYDEYVLEVADTNTNAIKLYEKLGFAEFMRIPQKHSERSGVNHLVYMKHVKKKEVESLGPIL
ncbi:acetyltransferase (GNAT) family protein [Cytobacillus firmus]|uniref:Acetyltransferase (GNAT) family protein n=2 Tax=Cytobacillus TaxID=2675230 RepID=A0A366K656_CYTFI|nr:MULTISPECIES: GNAT family N-acetyltransferase [Cytobacillus]RBP96061.1 acetyltransferase (GNAT) family protein [Cytobacillus firmus]TDX44974.1 acetyltransferase (GNAT) family protein [Cytobacillus oceanisediminis]